MARSGAPKVGGERSGHVGQVRAGIHGCATGRISLAVIYRIRNPIKSISS